MVQNNMEQNKASQRQRGVPGGRGWAAVGTGTPESQHCPLATASRVRWLVLVEIAHSIELVG